MPAYHLYLVGRFEAETWDEALEEAERLRLTISNARQAPSSMPFSGTVSDGRSRPPGIPATEDEFERVTGGFARLGGYGGNE